MTSLIGSAEPTATSPVPPSRPSLPRRVALVLAGVLTCTLPIVFGVSLTRMLVTGELPDHRFHQVTGQGLVLVALWLLPILVLLRAGWRGRRPGTAAGWQHLLLVTAGAACAAAAPVGGAPILIGVVLVGGVALWAALPERPGVRTPLALDPLLAPVALATSALLLPYAVDQLVLQNAATGHHAANPHLFDMAWVAVVVTGYAVLAAVAPAARALAAWSAACLVVLGAAGLAFGEGAGWSTALLALGALGGALSLARHRQDHAGARRSS